MPKASWGLILVIVAQISGFVWWTAQQASTISNLEATVSVLNATSNTTDKINMIRDIEQNKMNIDEMIDILAEFYEDMEDADDDIYLEIDELHEATASMASHMMAIVKLQSRVAILEKTVEFTRRDGI
jgi:hypothetical protein